MATSRAAAAASLVALLAASACSAEPPGPSGPETVSFPTSDGGVVFGDLYGSGERAVVLAHGGRFTKESWAKQAPVIADAGFRVLAIDFRGKGSSRGGEGLEDSWDGYPLDVLAAVRYLRDHGATSVSVVGGSIGGWAGAEACVDGEPGDIDRLVLLAGSPIDEPERMACRALFLVAQDDPEASGRPRLEAIRGQYERAPGPKELIVVDGSAHAQYLFDTDQGERVLGEIVRFLSAP